MTSNPFHLLTAVEVEKNFGKRYFYRQRVYRLAESGKIPGFQLRGQTCFLGSHILKAFMADLEHRIKVKFPEINASSLSIFYDTVNRKRVVVDGLFGKGISINTDEETEEDLLEKISHIMEWIEGEHGEPVKQLSIEPEAVDKSAEGEASLSTKSEAKTLADVLPEEISWVRVDTDKIEGVEVKSYILISLASVAQFIGIRSDNFVQWLSKTTFSNFVLSIHPQRVNGTRISVPLKKGAAKGYAALIPFELLPEVIVAFRQSNRTIRYPEKAELLYSLAKRTLEAVGLAISGDKNRAAEELAKVGEGLGLTVADQIIGIFKQYETRDYQIRTTREFHGKIKKLGGNYAAATGSLTFGVTGRHPWEWKSFGASRNLPKAVIASSREVMRELAPADGVGMTFGERHYIKDPKIEEAVATGRQGKSFYQRLKNVGLLDE